MRLNLNDTHTTPAAIEGHDGNGVPLTVRAQWLVSLFARKAIRKECDYLLKCTVDPITKEVLAPDVPIELCERCGSPFHKTYHYAHTAMCKNCQPRRRRNHGKSRT